MSKAAIAIPDRQDQDWKLRAKCRNLDYDDAMVLFFPEKGHATRDGKLFCSGRPASPRIQAIPECPVRQECLAYAISFEPEGLVGVWGGTAQHDRRRIYEEMRRSKEQQIVVYRTPKMEADNLHP